MKEYKVIVDDCGTARWYKPGTDILHRDDGPAIEYTCWKGWYQNGKRNRLDGPAVERSNGNKEWYIENKEYTEEKFNAEIAKRNKIHAPACEYKIVEIDGKRYKLTSI